MLLNKDDIVNYNLAVTHILLNNSDVVKKVVETPEWLENKTVSVTLQFNGVESDPSILEKLLQDWYADIVSVVKSDYSDLDLLVEKRVKEQLQKIVETKITPYQEKLRNIVDQLEQLESTYYLDNI